MKTFWNLCLCFFALSAMPIMASPPDQKIHVLLDFVDRLEFSNSVESGLRLALQAEGQSAVWPSLITTTASADTIHTVTSYNFTVSSTAFSVIVSHIPRSIGVEAHGDFFEAADNDDTVLSAFCMTSGSCAESRAATNLLVISPTATSSALLTTSEYRGLILMSPTNALQSRAIYKYMKENLISNFVVIYEPGMYGSDLYSSLHAEYVSEYYRAPESSPAFLTAMPLYDKVFETDNYRALKAAQIMDCIDKLVEDELFLPSSSGAIVYLGEQEGFGELAGSPAVNSYRWLAGDALYDANPMEKFKIRYTPAGSSEPTDNSSRVFSLHSFMMAGSTESGFAANQLTLNNKYKNLYGKTTDIDLYAQYGYDSGLFLKQALQVALNFQKLNQSGIKTEAELLDLRVTNTYYPVVTSSKGRNFTQDGWFQVFGLNKSSNDWYEHGQAIFIESAQNAAVRRVE